MVLAFNEGSDLDEVVSFSKDIGYIVSDIRPREDKHERDYLLPFDSHPGPLTQSKYAEKLLQTITEHDLIKEL